MDRENAPVGGGACYPEHVTGKVGVNRRWKMLHGGSGEVDYILLGWMGDVWQGLEAENEVE